MRRRRSALMTGVACTAAALVGATTLSSTPARPAAAAPLTQAASTTITISEGTNTSLAVAPDGSIVMDLQGLLFRVPASGGEARQLTKAELDPARPDVGPDGRIVFQGYADGTFHVWIADPDGSNAKQITTGRFDHREPRWSPDGRSILFSSDRAGTYDIWSLELSTGALKQWTKAEGQEFEPSWHPDGDQVAYIADDHVETVTSAGEARVAVQPVEGASMHSPAWAPDGARIAYVQRSGNKADLMVSGEAVTRNEDVFVFTPEWTADNELLYTADGKIRRLDLDRDTAADVGFEAKISLPDLDYDHKTHDFDSRTPQQVKGILTPALSPDATKVLFVALNDLWLMPIGGKPERLTDDSFYEVDPVWSRDGKRIAYSSDRDGTQDIYVRDVASGEERKVTALDGAEVAAAFSPDGRQLAFQDQAGATYVMDLDGDSVRELVPSLFGPGRPTWSADGKTIAFAAVKRYSQRFREGTSQILTVDVATGEQHFHAPGAEHASLSTRGDDGPVWSPDGKHMAFVVDSTLRVMPVGTDGAPSGDARQVTTEATDAPSWSGDSTKVLYLSNGKLRLLDLATKQTETVDVPLTYKPDVATGRTVIHAGAFWDGESKNVRKNVDITVVGNRIKSIEPHDKPHQDKANGNGTRFIDASGQTVMPGLWDAHVHQELSSRFFGDRQGRLSLAYGLTSTVSVGDQVYRAMEDRESLRAGERVGPRFFATGEPIDGSRVYYNFMRPTTTDEQVDLELTRAKDLDYDFVKTYVRLPTDRMKKVIDFAHEMGVPSGSHYLSPGAHLGQDGTTHLAATQRLGFARTQSATGHSYADVPALYGQGKRAVTTTYFTEDTLYADELRDDARLQLLPSWEREALWEGVSDNDAPPSDPDCQTSICQQVRTMAEVAEQGGRVLAGTDSPLDNVALGLHANLRMLVAHGWTPYDALRTAIVNPAEHFGVSDDVGTLKPGKVADLIAVDGNPLERIEDAMNVKLTMAAGHAYTPEQLLAPFSSVSGTQSATTGRTDKAGEASAQDAVATRVAQRADAKAASKYWWHAEDVVARDYAHACDAYEDVATHAGARARPGAHSHSHHG